MSPNIYWINERLGMMPVPKGGDDLPMEIRRLKEHGVSVLVSLLPQSESKMLGLERQEELCEADGIRLMNFPIEDFNVPVDNEAALQAVSKVSEALEKNEKAVVHCRGGIGRSSLFAGALLVKSGLSAEEAFALLGKCRGCKVPETPAQETWLKEFENRLKNK